MPRRLTRRELLGGTRLGGTSLAPGRRSLTPSVIPLSRERQLLARATFGPTNASIAEIESMGWSAWFDWQLDHKSIDDSELEDQYPGLLPANPGALAATDFAIGMTLSRRQLAWKMTWFLNNHFNTDIAKSESISEFAETRGFFENCFGSFADVLMISAKSPAMVQYLDSNTSIAAAPNENYTRELFELHTLGVFGGYSEADIVEGARIFTGWSVAKQRDNPTAPGGNQPNGTVFRFRPFRHDSGPKNLTALGFSTPGFGGQAGVQEGEALLAFLANHPSTVDFVVGKLAKFFVADDPPQAVVDRAKVTWNATGGNLGQVLHTLFKSPETYDMGLAREKTQDGIEFAVGSFRRLETQVSNLRPFANWIVALGQPIHQQGPPTGYPEESSAWQGPGNVLTRWSFAEALTHNQIPAAVVPWAQVGGNPAPTTPTEWVDRLLDKLVDADVPATTRTSLITFLTNRFAALPANPSSFLVLQQIRDVAGLVLRLPEAQVN